MQCIVDSKVLSINKMHDRRFPCCGESPIVQSTEVQQFTRHTNLVDSHCEHCHNDRNHAHELDKDVE